MAANLCRTCNQPDSTITHWQRLVLLVRRDVTERGRQSGRKGGGCRECQSANSFPAETWLVLSIMQGQRGERRRCQLEMRCEQFVGRCNHLAGKWKSAGTAPALINDPPAQMSKVVDAAGLVGRQIGSAAPRSIRKLTMTLTSAAISLHRPASRWRARCSRLSIDRRDGHRDAIGVRHFHRSTDESIKEFESDGKRLDFELDAIDSQRTAPRANQSADGTGASGT